MLRHIPSQCYVGQITAGMYTFPHSIDTNCPYCGRRVNVTLLWDKPQTGVVEYSVSHCPACQQKVTLLFLPRHNGQHSHIPGDLFIHPGDDIRQPLEGIEENDQLTEGLKRAYYSTINVLNSQEWTATTVLCRQVLEGITKHIVADEHKSKTLATQIKELPSQIDLSRPILTLADAIRKGGNLGAHFDLEKEPNQEMSSLMVDLLDDLIEYIFILPSRIQHLHDRIEGLPESK